MIVREGSGHERKIIVLFEPDGHPSFFEKKIKSASGSSPAKLAIPHLEKTKRVIVNISSVVSKYGGTLSTPYFMSKAAVDSLTKCTAVEVGPKGIRVVGIP